MQDQDGQLSTEVTGNMVSNLTKAFILPPWSIFYPSILNMHNEGPEAAFCVTKLHNGL